MTTTLHNEDVIALSEEDINESLANSNKEQILKGLFRAVSDF